MARLNTFLSSATFFLREPYFPQINAIVVAAASFVIKFGSRNSQLIRLRTKKKRRNNASHGERLKPHYRYPRRSNLCCVRIFAYTEDVYANSSHGISIMLTPDNQI